MLVLVYLVKQVKHALGRTLVPLATHGNVHSVGAGAAVTTAQLKYAGCGVQELKCGGFSVQELMSAGYNLSALIGGSFTVAEMKGAGCAVQRRRLERCEYCRNCVF